MGQSGELGGWRNEPKLRSPIPYSAGLKRRIFLSHEHQNCFIFHIFKREQWKKNKTCELSPPSRLENSTLQVWAPMLKENVKKFKFCFAHPRGRLCIKAHLDESSPPQAHPVVPHKAYRPLGPLKRDHFQVQSCSLAAQSHPTVSWQNQPPIMGIY